MKILTIGLLLLFTNTVFSQKLSVYDLSCEHKTNPLCVDATQPRLSWKIKSAERNMLQSSYSIRVVEGINPSSKNIVWESGKINTDESVLIPYSGKLLQSGKRYYWQVKVWDNHNNESPWSDAAYWEMGLLKPEEWKANWIEPGFAEDSVMRPTPLFRKEFKAVKKIQSATVYVAAHGMYEGYINGRRVGDFYLTPGWTSYNKRLQYQTYDVTDLLNEGANVIAMGLGSGWYRGHLAWNGNKNTYGKDIALLFQLTIIYTDGSKELIISDGSWKSATGSITYSEIYNGEIIDARKQKTGWRTIGYDDSNWSGVKVGNYDKSNLVATENEPIKKHETFTPVKIFITPKANR